MAGATNPVCSTIAATRTGTRAASFLRPTSVTPSLNVNSSATLKIEIGADHMDPV